MSAMAFYCISNTLPKIIFKFLQNAAWNGIIWNRENLARIEFVLK